PAVHIEVSEVGRELFIGEDAAVEVFDGGLDRRAATQLFVDAAHGFARCWKAASHLPVFSRARKRKVPGRATYLLGTTCVAEEEAAKRSAAHESFSVSRTQPRRCIADGWLARRGPGRDQRLMARAGLPADSALAASCGPQPLRRAAALSPCGELRPSALAASCGYDSQDCG